MRWEDERYVRIYTRDTGDWLALSFEAQAVWMLMLRKLDRAGFLHLGKDGRAALPRLLGHPSRAREIDAALEELLADGCVRFVTPVTGVTANVTRLFAPNFTDAQEWTLTAAERAKKYRDRKRAEQQGPADRGVTNVTNVTRPSPPLPVPPVPSSSPPQPTGGQPQPLVLKPTGPKTRTPSLQEKFYRWASERRLEHAGGAADQAWSAKRINAQLSFVKEHPPEDTAAAFDLFLDDERKADLHPKWPMWAFVQDFPVYLSRLKREAAHG